MTKKLKYFLSSVLFAAVLAAVCLFVPTLATPVSADDVDFYYSTAREDLQLENDLIMGFRDTFDESAHTSIKLVIPDNILGIAANAFNGNTKLVNSIEFPASVTSVGENAFSGCTGITSVSFAENKSGTLSIGASAFANCSALTVAELPAQLDSVGASAFAGSGLSTLYIRSNNVSEVTFAASSVPDGTLVVFDGWLGYVQGSSVNSLALCDLTFVQPVNFYYGNGLVETVDRLAGKSFDLVKKSDGTWATAAAGFVPVQPGYTVSAWYDTDDFGGYPFYSNNLTEAVEMVNQKLAVPPSGELQLNYYAKYINQPAIDTAGLVYDETKSYSEEDLPTILAGDYDFTAMKVTLLGDKEVVDDAGDYNIRIELYPNFGEWAAPYDTIITVQRKTITLSDHIDWLGGRINDRAGALLDGNVFIYKKGDDTRYSFTRLPDTELGGYEYYSNKAVVNSVMRNLQDDVTVTLAESEYYEPVYSNLVFSGMPVESGVITAREEGMYVAKSVVTAGGNYKFTSEGNYFSSRGLTVELSADHTQALLSKEWYLLNVGNGVYVEDTTDSYSIDGWTYNDIVNINKPVLQFGEGLKFSLTLTFEGKTEVIIGNETIDNFRYYVNVTMPAGNYRLTLHVPAAHDGDTEYLAYDAVYTFSVTPAAFDSSWADDIKAKLVDTEWTYREDADGNPLLQLYSHASTDSLHAVQLEVWDAFNSANKLNPRGRIGFWEETQNNRFYSDRFYLTYNLSRMQNKTYYSFEELNGLAEKVVPKGVDDYVVYYQLKAHNYESLVDENDDAGRRSYKFGLTLYEVVQAPVIAEVSYTGADVKPAVPFDRRYSATYNDATGYVNAGVHTITLTSTDPVHYRWTAGASETEATCTINFTIARAQNLSKRLDVFGWNYGDFDSERDKPRLETVYGSDGDYDFKLVSASGTVYELWEFNNAPVGTYTLNVTVNGYDPADASTVSYNWLKLEVVSSLRVLKATNRWVTTPTIASWTAGSYNPEENKIEAKTALGGEYKVIISVAGDVDDVVYDSEKGIDNLSSAAPGLYLVSVVVAETDDFSEISHVFNMRIFERPGLPWWAIVLIVLGSFGVAALVIYILQRKGVLQILTGRIVFAMRTKATVDATLAAIRANKKAEEAKLSLARARAEDAREARRQQMLEEKNMTIDEQAAALDEQVKKTEMKAHKLNRRAEHMRKKADKLKDQASKADDAAGAENAQPEAPAEPAEPANDSATTEETPGSEE